MSDLAAWAQWLADSVAKTVQERLCRPASTYRLQFEAGKWTFRDAAALAPYLADLGISHLYSSPCLKTRSGSTHGYAIVDYTQLNPELGGLDDFRAMVDSLHNQGLGQIFDIVPNHMSATPAENLWWTDVLENGPSSPRAAYFDIDWRPVKEELRNRILLPILGSQYGQVLESGELQLEYRDGGFCLRYYQALLPLDPRTYRTILTPHLDVLKQSLPEDSEEMRELESILTALEHLPNRTETEPARVAERQREKEVIKGRLRKLAEGSPPILEFIQSNVKELNGAPENPRSFDPLDKLLDGQVYRLSHWKAAADEINYRRFFDVHDLAAVCMEEPGVFAESHRLLFELVLRGDLDGLRVDHIDGLYDPLEYLWRLQSGYLLELGKARYERMTAELAAGNRENDLPEAQAGEPPPWNELEPAFLSRVTALTCSDRSRPPLFVVVEKILGIGESISEQWLLAGTTGYEFLNDLSGLFVQPNGLAELTKLYNRFIDSRLGFREVVLQSKLLIMRTVMSSDLALLAHRINRISERHRRSRDFTLNTLRVALRDLFACFSVYRTYIRQTSVPENDRMIIARATAQAKRRNSVTDPAAFDFIRDVLLLEAPPQSDEAMVREREMFVGRFQQTTSPVTAKGIEDTAFYRYIPLTSLNEVGGDPDHAARSVEEFHRHNIERQAKHPRSLIATTTHDTKRTEDARARINVLSEVPSLWRTAVNRWARLNRRHHRVVDGQLAPCRNDEYLFYQSLVGVWPLSPPEDEEWNTLVSRLTAYMEKATHEAKVSTSWINPNVEYDAAVREFVAAALDGRPKNRFVSEFQQFHNHVIRWGLYSALSQTLLKLTSPGVPDLYQGQETWDFSLVDPDNRRPVDFSRRRDLLSSIQHDVALGDASMAAMARYLAEHPDDLRTKLFVTWRTLQLRRKNPDLFQEGDYIPLEVTGSRAEHVCAFVRRVSPMDQPDRPIAIIIAPRWLSQLTPASRETGVSPPPLGPMVWEDTHLMVRQWVASPLKNLFTGQVHTPDESPLYLAKVFADFPVAILVDVRLST